MGNAERAVDGLSLAVAGVTFAGLAVALAMLGAAPIPAMLDYVNHLSRMYLLAGGPSPAYVAHFRLCTDLAMDLFTPTLARVVGVQVAAKVFVGLSQVLVVTGAMALEWVQKRRLRLGGPAALLVLFSLPFAWGLTNFMFGLGLAVWGVALWIGLRERPLPARWTAHALVVAALFVSHLFDLGLYGLTLGLYELSRMERRPDPWSLLRLATFMASPALLALGVAALLGGDGVGQPIFHWDSFGVKLKWAFIFMNVYDLPVSILTGALLLGAVGVLAATGRLKLTRPGVWIAAGYGIVYVCLPRMMFGTQHQDVRLLTAAALVLPAFTLTRLPSGPWRRLPIALATAIVGLNYATVANAWVDRQLDYRQIAASFPLLAPNSTVLTAVEDKANRIENQPLYYAPTLAAAPRGVFVFSLYSMAGMQPIEPRARFRALVPRDPADYSPPVLSVLLAAAKGAPGAPERLRGWTTAYRYLYVIGPPGANPWPAELTRIAAGRSFALYRIGA